MRRTATLLLSLAALIALASSLHAAAPGDPAVTGTAPSTAVYTLLPWSVDSGGGEAWDNPRATPFTTDPPHYWLKASSVGHISQTSLSGTSPSFVRYSARSGYVAQLTSISANTGPNTPPVINKPADLIAGAAITEDCGAVTINLSGIQDNDLPQQTLTVTATSSNLSLMLNPTVRYSGSGPTGQLLFAPLPDANGDTRINITVTDNGQPAMSATTYVDVHINAVNDPPTIDQPANQSMSENGTLLMSLTGIGPGGGPDEATQTVTITAASSDTSVLQNPTVLTTSGATRTLRLQPPANAYGTASVLVRAADSLGGVTYRFFTVTINHVAVPPVLQQNVAALTTTVYSTATSTITNTMLRTTDADGPSSQVYYDLMTAPTLGEVRLRGNVLSAPLVNAFTQSDIDSGLVAYRAPTVVSPTSDSFTIVAHDGDLPAPGNWWTTTPAQSPANQPVPFTIDLQPGAPPNSAPTVTLPGPSFVFVEGDPPILVDTTATVTDADNNIGGGSIRASVVPPSNADVIAVRSGGTITVTSSVSGGVTTYDIFFNSGGTSTHIGQESTVSNGLGGNELRIDLDGVGVTNAMVQQLVRALTYYNASVNPVAGAHTFQLIVADADDAATTVSKAFTIQPIDTAPTIAWQRNNTTYTEGSAAVAVSSLATVGDVDSADFNGGWLTINLASGDASDRLSVQDDGTGGEISLVGTRIYYHAPASPPSNPDDPVGLLSGNGVTGLRVDFDYPTATPAAVQALMRHLLFRNVSQAPSPAVRTITAQVDDGDDDPSTTDGVSTVASMAISVALVNDAPVVTPLVASQSVSWIKASPPPQVAIDTSGTITDVDSPNFNGGNMQIDFTNGATIDDRIGIFAIGTVADPITVVTAGGVNTVKYNNVAIGTASGFATSTGPLVINFTSSAATPAAASAVLHRLYFTDVSATPVGGTRSIMVQVRDGSGGTSQVDPNMRVVNVQNVLLSPSVTVSGATAVFNESPGTPVALDTTATVTDADSANFNGGHLIVSYTGSTTRAEDALTILRQGSGNGQIDTGTVGGVTTVYFQGLPIGTAAGGGSGSGLDIAFAGTDATPAAAQALLRAIAYRDISNNPITADRQLQVVVNDGSGAAPSSPRLLLVHLVPYDDPPTVGTPTAGTIDGVPVVIDLKAEAFASDPDTALAAMIYDVPTQTSTGNNSVTRLLDAFGAPNGKILYQPLNHYVGDDTFSFTVADRAPGAPGYVLVPGTGHVHVTRRLDENRPHVVSDGAREAFDAHAYVYDVRVEGSQLVGAPTITFHLTGNVPAGMLLTVTGATTATVTWPVATGTINTHAEFGLLFTDTATGTSGYQPLEYLLRAPPVGGG